MTPQHILRKSLCRPAHCFSAHVPGQGIDNLGWASHYAEPGHVSPRKAVLLANWNLFPSRIDQVLERAGYDVQWSDEWTVCEDCNGAVRTSPDSYVWTPAYREVNGSTVCVECAK